MMSAWPKTLDRDLLEEPFEHRRLVALAWCEHEGQRLAASLGSEVDLGARAALASPESFRHLVAALGSSGVLVRSNDRPIDEVDFPVDPTFAISPLLGSLELSLPDASPLPPVEGTRDARPDAVALGQLSPGCSSSRDPE